jgi:FMN-dependent oxidoreductase (nitrilotriacetate monooxygenase family)
MRLGAFMRPVGIHAAWWRYPGSRPDSNVSFPLLKRYAQTLERGCFDFFFMADHLAVPNIPMQALKRRANMVSFDPLTLLPALAVCTEHIGLVATASTTYNEPYHVARKFASLDHISEGRAGWNMITSGDPTEAWNFGRDHHVQHAVRYARAREFHDVVTGLWDSWADDAFLYDQESGLFFDPAKLHQLDHKGEHLSVRGPLNVPRPVQGWPVIFQAGASEAGRQVAAETAEIVFAWGTTIEEGRELYADIKGRARRYGRSPDHIKIMPGALIVTGATAEEAQSKKRLLDSLVHDDIGMPNLTMRLGDLSAYDPDGPVPDLPPGESSQSLRKNLIDRARREQLTIRQLARIAGGYSGLDITGTPAMIADTMEEWVATGACDGFNIMFPFLPEGLDDFVTMVVPELQRRGLFRRRYRGRTLRENLGLPRPSNQFFPATAPLAARG